MKTCKSTAPPVRKYARVNDELRQQLISLLDDNMSIKDAAKQIGINYENAKVINRIYREEGRTSKKK